jgi:hypothetical protein
MNRVGVLSVLGAVLIAGCGASKAEEDAKSAKTRFAAGQPCIATTLNPKEATYKTACEEQQRKEQAEKQRTERREAAERKAQERREKAEQRAQEAKTKREEAETKAKEEKTKSEEAKAKFAEEHKGEANNHHRWSEELRAKEVSACVAAAASGESSKNTCECAMNKMEAVESEEQMLQLEAIALSQGSAVLSRLIAKAHEGC